MKRQLARTALAMVVALAASGFVGTPTSSAADSRRPSYIHTGGILLETYPPTGTIIPSVIPVPVLKLTARLSDRSDDNSGAWGISHQRLHFKVNDVEVCVSTTTALYGGTATCTLSLQQQLAVLLQGAKVTVAFAGSTTYAPSIATFPLIAPQLPPDCGCFL